MTALNRSVAFGTGEDDGYPDDATNDNTAPESTRGKKRRKRSDEDEDE